MRNVSTDTIDGFLQEDYVAKKKSMAPKFEKLKGGLAKKGAKNPGGLAAYVGNGAYGAGKKSGKK